MGLDGGLSMAIDKGLDGGLAIGSGEGLNGERGELGPGLFGSVLVSDCALAKS